MLYPFLQENVSLIKEINDLRKELKIVRVKNHDLEAALGLHRKNNKDVSQLLQAVTSQNKNAMMEEDVKERGKVSIVVICLVTDVCCLSTVNCY